MRAVAARRGDCQDRPAETLREEMERRKGEGGGREGEKGGDGLGSGEQTAWWQPGAGPKGWRAGPRLQNLEGAGVPCLAPLAPPPLPTRPHPPHPRRRAPRASALLKAPPPAHHERRKSARQHAEERRAGAITPAAGEGLAVQAARLGQGTGAERGLAVAVLRGWRSGAERGVGVRPRGRERERVLWRQRRDTVAK